MKALAIAIAVLMVPVAAQAASKNHRTQSQYQPKIACTDVGCLPVPRGCYPTGGKTFDGGPTGFDVMVCPNGVRYGHL